LEVAWTYFFEMEPITKVGVSLRIPPRNALVREFKERFDPTSFCNLPLRCMYCYTVCPDRGFYPDGNRMYRPPDESKTDPSLEIGTWAMCIHIMGEFSDDSSDPWATIDYYALQECWFCSDYCLSFKPPVWERT